MKVREVLNEFNLAQDKWSFRRVDYPHQVRRDDDGAVCAVEYNNRSNAAINDSDYAIWVAVGYSNYSGGVWHRAITEFLLESVPHAIVTAWGGYGTEAPAFSLSAEISEDDAELIREVLSNPQNYSDEIAEISFRIEEEWIQEGWGSWIYTDMMTAVGEIDEDLAAKLDEMDTGALLQYVRVLSAESGIDWIPECSGIHVDTRELAKTLAENPPEL